MHQKLISLFLIRIKSQPLISPSTRTHPFPKNTLVNRSLISLILRVWYNFRSWIWLLYTGRKFLILYKSFSARPRCFHFCIEGLPLWFLGTSYRIIKRIWFQNSSNSKGIRIGTDFLFQPYLRLVQRNVWVALSYFGGISIRYH